MFSHLQIRNRRERTLVGLADAVTMPVGWWSRRPPDQIRRVLLMRLERLGDLLMTRDAIGRARQLLPAARIDLAVGSWNAELARLLPGINRLEVMDVPWLARTGTGWSWGALIAGARRWKRQGYDLVLNFEPDIRSNFLSWLSGGCRRAGYFTGGGGAFLTDSWAYAPTEHVSTNASRLVYRALQVDDDDAKAGAGARLHPWKQRQRGFGAGNGVNRFLLDGMAHAGRGEVEYVTLESQGDEAAKKFHGPCLAIPSCRPVWASGTSRTSTPSHSSTTTSSKVPSSGRRCASSVARARPATRSFCTNTRAINGRSAFTRPAI